MYKIHRDQFSWRITEISSQDRPVYGLLCDLGKEPRPSLVGSREEDSLEDVRPEVATLGVGVGSRALQVI